MSTNTGFTAGRKPEAVNWKAWVHHCRTLERHGLRRRAPDWRMGLRRVHLADLARMPILPARVKVNELITGLVCIIHATPSRSKYPWLESGWYRFIGHDGRLYVVEITPSVKGAWPTTAWLYRPKVRVPARSAPAPITASSGANDSRVDAAPACAIHTKQT
jgi:hypothetical protein